MPFGCRAASKQGHQRSVVFARGSRWNQVCASVRGWAVAAGPTSPHARFRLAICPPEPQKQRMKPSTGVRALPILLAAAILVQAAPPGESGRIELLRDSWGIPHVFSDTDVGAFYGLGYATAEERGFQMTYSLRIIQGRLAAIIGDRPKGNRRDGAVQSDRLMRTLGWSQAARRIANELDPETKSFLEAYCDGVNDSFAAQKAEGRRHPLFAQLGVDPELWTPADCLLSWWHVGQFFATDGTRDLMAWRNRQNPAPGRPDPSTPSPTWKDDAAAVVQVSDVPVAWREQVAAFSKSFGFGSQVSPSAAEGPKFSHAWVVGGTKTTTGAAVLVSDPQTPVRQPSLWMEFHIVGGTFNVRGVGVPGSPGLLIGFNTQVAWGLTALGADQADLFRLETSAEQPDQYRWEGQWRPMTTRQERIQVKDQDDVALRVRETHLGPVVSAFAFRQDNDPEVALKRIPLCETKQDTIQSVVALMRATNVAAFRKALGAWRFPSANCVFGDAQGNIGYTIVGALPIRSRNAPDPNGNLAGQGRTQADDWRGFLPPDLLPQVINPRPGYLLSANHRPIASFYDIPLGLSTGSMGDTIRSWRLRERLQQPTGKFTPGDVLAIHHDAVNPARRELVRLGLHFRATQQARLSPSALQALDILGPWLEAGARSDLSQRGADLASRISTFFRFVSTPLAFEFGGGESGLARFLRHAAQRIEADPKAEFSAEEWEFVDQVLANAWEESKAAAPTPARGRSGSNPMSVRPLPWFDSLDGFGSLDRSFDLQSPALNVVDGQTIRSQAAQSYTQWVPLQDPDAARTVCPIGHSDRPDGPYRASTMNLWGKGELHPAPLSRAAVERIATFRQDLSKSPR